MTGLFIISGALALVLFALAAAVCVLLGLVWRIYRHAMGRDWYTRLISDPRLVREVDRER